VTTTYIKSAQNSSRRDALFHGDEKTSVKIHSIQLLFIKFLSQHPSGE